MQKTPWTSESTEMSLELVSGLQIGGHRAGPRPGPIPRFFLAKLGHKVAPHRRFPVRFPLPPQLDSLSPAPLRGFLAPAKCAAMLQWHARCCDLGYVGNPLVLRGAHRAPGSGFPGRF